MMPPFAGRLRVPLVLLLAGLLALGSHLAMAQESRWSEPAAAVDLPKQPDDPTAAKAFVVLDRACAQCHQTGKLAGRAAGAGLNRILDLEALARDGTLVRPGNPDGSRLYTLLQTRMPPHDVDQSGKDLLVSGIDLDAVREWIAGLEAIDVGCPDRAPVSRRQASAAIQDALDAAGPEAAPTLRFLSLSHLHNACAPAADMKAYRYAAMVAINSLSWGLKPALLDGIDADETVLKIDLRAMGWDAARWDRLVAAYPFGAVDGDQRLVGDRSLEKGPTQRVVRADWFAATALKPPLYYDLLGLPDRVSTLLASLKIDLAADIAQNRARRIGVKTSQVARGSRLIQRQPFANGAFWTSYEYAPTPGRPDLFDAPGGPGSRGAPKPDAALMMFSLPSGFNAFFMANGEGMRLNDVPQSVLRNDSHPSQRVAAGASCLACHGRGVERATDELRARVQGDTSVPRDIREKVLAMHPAADDMQKLIDEDSGRLAGAIAQSGLVPGVTLGGEDPVAGLVRRYERDVTIETLAAELDVTTATIRDAAGAATGPAADVLQRIVHGPVPRRHVELVVSALVAVLAGLPNPSDAPAVADVERLDAPQLIMKTGAARFKVGDAFSVRVRTTETCYVTLINIDRNGRGTIIYPNDFEPANSLEAGKELKVPADGAPYVFRLREPGRETVVGICQSVNKSPSGIRHDFERQRFTELGDYRAFLNRSAGNEPENRAIAARQNEARLRRRSQSVPQTPALPAAAGRVETQIRSAVQFDIMP